MNNSMKIMNKISTKIPVALVAMLFFVMLFGFSSSAYASYTAQEITDYINNNLAGASDAEIAAVASSFGVSADEITNAYEEVYQVDVSDRAEEAYEEVITVTDTETGTNYYTTASDSSNVYSSDNA